MTEVPPGLTAYPSGLAIRVTAALVVTYAVAFALWVTTARAMYVIAGVLLALAVLAMLSESTNTRVILEALSTAWTRLGLAVVYGGRWWLIDV